MNYYQARQTVTSGVWRWTCRNDGKIWACDGCTEECQHATREEAERHHYEYRAANLHACQETDAQHRCEVPGCGAWTSHMMHVAGEIAGSTSLCEAHLNADGWQAANPFVAGVTVMSS